MPTIRLVVFIALSIILPQILFAQLQWEKAGSFPDRIQLVYFTDELHGFVSIGTVPGSGEVDPKLFHTSDGGATWKQVTVDQLTKGYGIQDMVMTDGLNGWACGACNAGYSVWHTTDGGGTWQTASSNDKRFSVSIRITAAGIVISDFYNRHVRLSTDGGMTFNDVFTPASSDNLLGMDFSDSLHGVLIASFRSDNPWYYTADGGATWSPSNLKMESWSVAAEKGTSNFYAAPEMWSTGSGGPTTVYRSTDNGVTWKVINQFGFSMTGGITAIGSTLYAQSQYTAGSATGIYHSVDSARSWQLLGGPGGFGDTRFIALKYDCHKSVIYAAGIDNVVYKAYDDNVNVGVQNQVTGVTTKYQPEANIHPNDTANVQININFPTASPAIGFIPTEAEYSIRFDPSVVEPSHASDIHPPAGWMKKSVNISNDSVDVLLADTSGFAIAADQNFGSVGFFALPTTKRKGASVTFSTLILRNDCAQVIGVPDKETGVLRMIGVETSGVANGDILEKKLRLYPNPATEELNISFEAMKDRETDVIILDVLGKTTLHRNIPIQPSAIFSLSIKTLPAGSYTLIVNAAALTLSEKFEVIKY